MEWVLSEIGRVKQFEAEAHHILGVHEGARSRVVLIEQSYREVDMLNVRQAKLLREALTCLTHGLYAAAHVVAWTAMMDYVQERLGSDGFARLNADFPKWSVSTVEQLREERVDFQLIEAACKLHLCTKSEEKALKGLLSQRNECAHPSSYSPGLNESLGYVCQVLRRIEAISARPL